MMSCYSPAILLFPVNESQKFLTAVLMTTKELSKCLINFSACQSDAFMVLTLNHSTIIFLLVFPVS